MKLRAPPTSEDELFQRARRLAGRDLSWLAKRLDRPVPPDLKHDKGWIGHRLEEALGATAGNLADCDFPKLGIELKTLPTDENGKVSGSTFVCGAPYDGGGGRHWESCWVRKKLHRGLWIPIVGGGYVGSRRIGTPPMWTPDAEEEAILAADYTELARILHSGELDQISGKRGQALQLRPKALHGDQTTWMLDDEGEWARAMPRAWYLRAKFTRRMLEKAFLL